MQKEEYEEMKLRVLKAFSELEKQGIENVESIYFGVANTEEQKFVDLCSGETTAMAITSLRLQKIILSHIGVA